MKDSGKMQLSEDGGAVEFRRGPHGALYEIDLRDVSTARQIIDWYFHLKDKSDVSPQILFDFMSALEKACDLHFGADLRDLFCTGGGQVKWPK